MRGGKPESAGPVCALEEPPIIEMESFGPMRADEATPAPFLARGCTPPADLARGLMRSPKFLPCRRACQQRPADLLQARCCLILHQRKQQLNDLAPSQSFCHGTRCPAPAMGPALQVPLRRPRLPAL